MSLSSSGEDEPTLTRDPTAVKHDEEENEEENCPLCLSPLPAMTWRRNERERLLCCGKEICGDCLRNVHNRYEEFVKRAMDLERRGGPEAIMPSAEIVVFSKCPMCRQAWPENDVEEFQQVQKHVEQRTDWAWAFSRLASFYQNGFGVAASDKLAAKYYRMGAEKGCGVAMFQYGQCLKSGCGVPRNTREACKWYEKAIASHVGAKPLACLGFNLVYGVDGVPKDEPRGFRLIKQAAEQGFPYAQCLMADCYVQGLGVEKSLERSLFWNKKAALQGNKMAMASYANDLMNFTASQNDGYYHLTGHSAVPEVLYWLRKSLAANGDPNIEVQTFIHKLEACCFQSCSHCGKESSSPSPASAASTGTTSVVKLKKCTRCMAACYCGVACEKAHWKAGHKRDCFNVAKADAEYEERNSS